VTSTFETYRDRLDSHRAALRSGLTDADVVAAIRDLDDAVADVDGSGFSPTPLTSQPDLAAALGVDADLWVKDETGNVSGSHKGRHLFGVALGHELARRAGETVDGRYAIASCGNAALAAAVVARAVDRPLDVFVPTWANPAVTDRIENLGATVVRSPRAQGVPGDPSHHALVAAIASGAVGFSVQGSETPTTIDGCRTMAYEIVDQLRAVSDTGADAPVRIDRLFVQVGGGALATALVTGLAAAPGLAALPRVHAVQPRGNHPLVRAWDRLVAELLDRDEPTSNPERAAAAGELGPADAEAARRLVARLSKHPERYMAPWPTEPVSYATGILDDVTYDWIPIVEATLQSGSFPIVAEEVDLEAAHRLGRARTGIDVCPTGTAGLGGLMGSLRDGSMIIESGERIVLIFSGRTRPGDPVPGDSPGP
jgi:threonine synthase